MPTILPKYFFHPTAQGNQISTYDHEVVAETAQFNLKERNIFGSSRLGSKQDSLNILTATLTLNYTQALGNKYYEFSNHLGNVLTVFNDLKIPLDENSDNIVDGFLVGITNSSDYSPFGVQLDGRTQQGDFYRRGFNGMEKDDEVKGGGNSYDFGARMYDGRVGRFLTLDSYYNSFGFQSPYLFSGNSPVYSIDYEGKYKVIVTVIMTTESGEKHKITATFNSRSPQIVDLFNETTGEKMNFKFKSTNSSRINSMKVLASNYTNKIIG
jgi:RHS repeat-associated protein